MKIASSEHGWNLELEETEVSDYISSATKQLDIAELAYVNRSLIAFNLFKIKVAKEFLKTCKFKSATDIITLVWDNDAKRIYITQDFEKVFEGVLVS